MIVLVLVVEYSETSGMGRGRSVFLVLCCPLELSSRTPNIHSMQFNDCIIPFAKHCSHKLSDSLAYDFYFCI